MIREYSIQLVALIALLVSGINAQSQSCNYFHRRSCVSDSELRMKEDMQSKSALFSKGQQSDFNMVAYSGQDYRIVLCASDFFSEPLEFRIYEKVRTQIESEAPKEAVASTTSESASSADDGWGSDDDTWATDSYSDDGWGSDNSTASQASGGKPKPAYKLVKELLYDNKDDGMAQEIEFTADNTKSLIIEVKVPGEADEKKLMIKEVGCVGVLVEHKKSGGLGF